MQHIFDQLGDFEGTLLTDGYSAYEKYRSHCTTLVLAQCWAHSRRYFEQAQEKFEYRLKNSKPIVDAIFSWCFEQRQRIDLVKTNKLSVALNYVMKREYELKIFLSDPEVPIDTNHLERALRAIPMGRKNRLFCWTECGAQQVGIIQSLLMTCKLHGVNPYEYLVDVLQRIETHPASRAIELIPRVWKETFADNPLRSDLAAKRLTS
ncbi:MAG: transposase [Candidatus Thiodiazotropha sp.]